MNRDLEAVSRGSTPLAAPPLLHLASSSNAPPSINTRYNRSWGNALSTPAASPVLTASLRPQLQHFSDDACNDIERRMKRAAAQSAREDSIAERAAVAAQKAKAAAEMRHQRRQGAAARHAKAAGDVVERQMRSTYRQLDRL